MLGRVPSSAVKGPAWLEYQRLAHTMENDTGVIYGSKHRLVISSWLRPLNPFQASVIEDGIRHVTETAPCFFHALTAVRNAAQSMPALEKMQTHARVA
jgi:hypothetical protein